MKKFIVWANIPVFVFQVCYEAGLFIEFLPEGSNLLKLLVELLLALHQLLAVVTSMQGATASIMFLENKRRVINLISKYFSIVIYLKIKLSMPQC